MICYEIKLPLSRCHGSPLWADYSEIADACSGVRGALDADEGGSGPPPAPAMLDQDEMGRCFWMAAQDFFGFFTSVRSSLKAKYMG